LDFLISHSIVCIILYGIVTNNTVVAKLSPQNISFHLTFDVKTSFYIR